MDAIHTKSVFVYGQVKRALRSGRAASTDGISGCRRAARTSPPVQRALQPGTLQRLIGAPHACFIEMGTAVLMRAEAYRTWLKRGVSDDEMIATRQYLQQERAFGSKRFQAMAEKTLGCPVGARRPGRPARAETKPEGII